VDSPAELSRRLVAGLDALAQRGPVSISVSDAAATAELAAGLTERLETMPETVRRLLHTADSGFAATGEWVDAAIKQQDTAVHRLARAARVVAEWAGDAERERTFLIRGHIRGWAHRWRREERGPAQADSDPEFISFAADCLAQAGIVGDHVTMIAAALRKDWRSATE
jgi:hypothetical protein